MTATSTCAAHQCSETTIFKMWSTSFLNLYLVLLPVIVARVQSSSFVFSQFFREEFKDEQMVDVKSLDIRNFLWDSKFLIHELILRSSKFLMENWNYGKYISFFFKKNKCTFDLRMHQLWQLLRYFMFLYFSNLFVNVARLGTGNLLLLYWNYQVVFFSSHLCFIAVSGFMIFCD